MEKLIEFLNKHGIPSEIKTEYHVQVKHNGFTFNVYPSKKTIYINGATSWTHYNDNGELLKFINLQINRKVSDCRSFRKTSYKAYRKLLWADFNKRKCFVCGKFIEKFEDSSLEHKIPLGLGGSNRLDNFELSHKNCNHERGCSL